jgi:hypothetical protein
VNGRRVKAEAFARAIDFSTNDRVRNRARALGEAMRAENGVVNAVAALESAVAS